MTWTVVWVPDAEAELLELWIRSPDRQEITNAVDEIDERLRRDPQNVGESRASGRRILIVPPLAVTYRVLVDDRVVRVVNVRDFPAKPS